MTHTGRPFFANQLTCPLTDYRPLLTDAPFEPTFMLIIVLPDISVPAQCVAVVSAETNETVKSTRGGLPACRSE